MAVVRTNHVKRGADERRLAKDNIRYIQQRPGMDRDTLTRVLFGSAGSLGRSEVYQFITDAPEDSLFYRIKLSPDPIKEDTNRDLRMQQLTRDMMKSLAQRVNTEIPWAAALHDDHTNVRHVHLLAVLPRRLNKHELEFLISEATKRCLEQRRGLDVGADRAAWLRRPVQKSFFHTLQTAKRTSPTEYTRPSLPRGGSAAKVPASCTCLRCRFTQTHDRQKKVHQCASCGRMLHQGKQLSLQNRKGREWERAR